jgi:hypothetical protein
VSRGYRYSHLEYYSTPPPFFRTKIINGGDASVCVTHDKVDLPKNDTTSVMIN